MQTIKRKMPKGLSESERLEDLFDKGFERIKLKRSGRNSRRTPYSVKMEMVPENGMLILQTTIYDRSRDGCRYIGTLKYTLCRENGIH